MSGMTTQEHLPLTNYGRLETFPTVLVFRLVSVNKTGFECFLKKVLYRALDAAIDVTVYTERGTLS